MNYMRKLNERRKLIAAGTLAVIAVNLMTGCFARTVPKTEPARPQLRPRLL